MSIVKSGLGLLKTKLHFNHNKQWLSHTMHSIFVSNDFGSVTGLIYMYN